MYSHNTDSSFDLGAFLGATVQRPQKDKTTFF